MIKNNEPPITFEMLPALEALTRYKAPLDLPAQQALEPSTPMLSEFAGHEKNKLHIFEYIEGAVVRVIVTGLGERLIGSEDRILYYQNDLIGDPYKNIVDGMIATKGSQGRLVSISFREILPYISVNFDEYREEGMVTIFYFKMFGGDISPNSAVYTPFKDMHGVSLVDVASIPREVYLNIESMSAGDANAIALKAHLSEDRWLLPISEVERFANEIGLPANPERMFLEKGDEDLDLASSDPVRFLTRHMPKTHLRVDGRQEHSITMGFSARSADNKYRFDVPRISVISNTAAHDRSAEGE